MILVVTGVGFLIHVYSIGYMAHDPDVRALLHLPEPLRHRDADPRARRQPAPAVRRLGGRRALLVSADRLLVRRRTRTRPPARRRCSSTASATRASCSGSSCSSSSPARWTSAASTQHLGRVAHRRRSAAGPCRRSSACCCFVGATGKSAQIPLYVWLPDAMAGPDAGLRADPRRHHGDGRRLHDRRGCTASTRWRPTALAAVARRRRGDRALRRHHRASRRPTSRRCSPTPR